MSCGFLKADAKTETELLDVLKRFSQAFSKRDAGGIIELFASDADTVFLGSSEGMVIGRVELKGLLERIFAHSFASWDLGFWSVSMKDSVAWVTADTVMHARVKGVDITRPYRITAVFEKRGEKWLLMQYHGSEQVKYQ